MVLNLTLLAMRGVCHNVVINIYVLFQRTRKALTLSTAGTVIWIRTSRFYIQKFKGDWNMCTLAEMCENFLIYTGCPRRNVSDFGRVFLMLKYTDITQNTCVQSWTVTEIMAREKCGLLAGPRTVPVSWQVFSMFVLECGVRWRKVSSLAVSCICASFRVRCGRVVNGW